ncbi:hypothetical protein ACFORH_39110 [Amycolatopsis roodepoortensis]|uniref:Uncharacterized protein n=1 Tax=Amycolatopsis roodepoortensis TaxID=700274 RepID=A0ABR9LKB9_9PSEU|nr:hypothetical protein [Amycolatopsis roodepoortensis]MBE1580526.1 hypothetical protein [Amycolatopsis roodepoortensis]
MTNADEADGTAGAARALGDLLAPIVHRNEQALHRDVSEVLNTWGSDQAGAKPLDWQLKPRDPWEPWRGQRLVGLAAAGDHRPDTIAAVLDVWAKLLKLEPREYGPGTLTFMSPRGSGGLPVEIWGVVDREAWEATER